MTDRLDQSQPRPAADTTPAAVLTVDPAPGTLSLGSAGASPNGSHPVALALVEHGSISDRVHTYHNIARSCAAYAVFYGAMAGQELIALRQKVGSRKFQPTLTESMPWLAVSTAYLYIGYAEKFEARLAAILPTAGRIELKSLPDPRDFEAAERTELFAQVRDKTGLESADQLWLALGLSRDIKRRGGDTSAFRKHLTSEQAHEQFLANSKADFEAALMAVDRIMDKKTWQSPSIPRGHLEDAEYLFRQFARDIAAFLK